MMNVPLELLIEPPTQAAQLDSASRRPQPRARLEPKKSPVDFWHAPTVIAENHFVYKSLSNWAFRFVC
jgi:hypothetical protein